VRHGEGLRSAICSDPITPLIGVFDMFSASVAAQHYDGLFVSRFGFAASHYGLPDIGLIAWPDTITFVQRLRLALPRHHHLLVDIDDGYVDPEVASHVVQRQEHSARPASSSGTRNGPAAAVMSTASRSYPSMNTSRS
jgi:2-methylisocitrate lyase-like PEP mutase family enzyme